MQFLQNKILYFCNTQFKNEFTNQNCISNLIEKTEIFITFRL